MNRTTVLCSNFQARLAALVNPGICDQSERAKNRGTGRSFKAPGNASHYLNPQYLVWKTTAKDGVGGKLPLYIFTTCPGLSLESTKETSSLHFWHSIKEQFGNGQSNDPTFFYTKNIVVFKQINHFKHKYLIDYLFTLMSQFTNCQSVCFFCLCTTKRTYFNFIFPEEKGQLGFLYEFLNVNSWKWTRLKKEVKNGWILVKAEHRKRK